MLPRLTILIPNYNRPLALNRLLSSVFCSIDAANAQALIKVLVIDDFSSAPLDDSIEEFLSRVEFEFRLQDLKRGNAEVAFLSGLSSIDTEYTWLLGNDDFISLDAVENLLRVLDMDDLGFVLLNPRIYKGWPSQGHVPIKTTSATVRYNTAFDLFGDFGFVTSTTTFPCIVFRTRPVATFHAKYELTKFATVYSHTFTLFAALRNEPALFVSASLVGFTLNERLEEQDKLEKQAPRGVMFHHQSLGLARLIKHSAEITGVPISFFGRCLEDEVDKDAMIVTPTTLAYFLTFFTIEQFIREAENIIQGRPGFGHLGPHDLEEIITTVFQFRDDKVNSIFRYLNELFVSMEVSPEWKVECLRRVQRELRADAPHRYAAIADDSETLMSPAKLHIPNYAAFPLRGVAADNWGRPIVRTDSKRDAKLGSLSSAAFLGT